MLSRTSVPQLAALQAQAPEPTPVQPGCWWRPCQRVVAYWKTALTVQAAHHCPDWRLARWRQNWGCQPAHCPRSQRPPPPDGAQQG